MLSFRKGDLIIIADREDKDKVRGSEPDWMSGECARTGRKGEFPTEFIHLLPTLSKPQPKILVSYISGENV